jgi:hypothetical protein
MKRGSRKYYANKKFTQLACFVNVIMLNKFTIDIKCTWMEETRNDNIILAAHALKSN